MAFGQTVRSIRESMGIAQEAMALQAEIDRSYFGAIERGEGQPSLDLVFRIAAALEVQPETLVRRVKTTYVETAHAKTVRKKRRVRRVV
jgi:XRE family transcriptional regulator, regulator of sulfur utilization